MHQRRLAIIAYDIVNDHRRRQLHNALKAWSVGGQKSVHEAYLSLSEAEELFVHLGQWVRPEEDSLLLFFPVSSRAIYRFGKGEELASTYPLLVSPPPSRESVSL